MGYFYAEIPFEADSQRSGPEWASFELLGAFWGSLTLIWVRDRPLWWSGPVIQVLYACITPLYLILEWLHMCCNACALYMHGHTHLAWSDFSGPVIPFVAHGPFSSIACLDTSVAVARDFGVDHSAHHKKEMTLDLGHKEDRLSDPPALCVFCRALPLDAALSRVQRQSLTKHRHMYKTKGLHTYIHACMQKA